jgi:hypothetical protein
MRSERIVSAVGLVACWCSLQGTILSLRLTKAVSCRMNEESRCWQEGSNARHRRYEGRALPTELCQLKPRLKIDKWRTIPLRIRRLIQTRLHDCPSNVWTFTMSNSKGSRIATHARRYRSARARNLDSDRRLKQLQVMFPSRLMAEGRDPPPVNLIYQALVRAYPASPRTRARRTIRPVDRTTARRRRSGWRMFVANAWQSS